MATDLNESTVLSTELDNSEWEQQQRATLDAEYEQGLREAHAERLHEESLIEASEPGAAEEMAAFRAREEAISGIEAQPIDPNSLSSLATEDIWGEPRNSGIPSEEKSESFLDRMISKVKDLGSSLQPNKSIVENGTWKLDPESGAMILTGAGADEMRRAVQAHNNTLEGHAERAEWESQNAEQTKAQELTNEAVEKTSKDGTPLRFETSTRTAEYQPGTNTVDFTNKSTSTKTELVPGEGLSGSPESLETVRSRTDEVLGAKIDRDEFDNSDQPLEIADRAADTRERGLESAKALASHELKTNAQVTLADKNDGIYNGKILGVTDSYLLQRSGPASAIAHDKGMFESLPSYGRDATILYSAGNARVSLQPIKDKGLGIER